jgi:hypothetical protein
VTQSGIATPELSHVDKRLFIRDEVLTPEEVLIAQLTLEVQKWLVKARGFNLHLIDFVY